jgi:TonB family protein
LTLNISTVPDESMFRVEPFAPSPGGGKRDRWTTAFEVLLALLLNLAFIFALFVHLPVKSAKLSEPKAIPVQLVKPQQAPPKPKLEEQPQSKPQPQPKPQPKPTYEFKGSGDIKKDKAGKVPTVDADKSKAKPEVAAKKVTPEAPKQTEAKVPDWAKKLASGYDLPTEKKSSNRTAQGSHAEDDSTDLKEGEGAGDVWSNEFKAQVESHTFIPPNLFDIIQRATLVEITVDRRGNLRGMRLVQSSGIREFDIGVMQGLRDAAPFRPLPPGAPDHMTGTWSVGPKDKKP